MLSTDEWKALAHHRQEMGKVHLRDLFASDPRRGELLTAEAGDLLLDYSKNRMTAETVSLLAALADRAGLRDRIEAMFGGEPVNTTEGRPAWHVALRRPDPPSEVSRELARMATFTHQIRQEQSQGHSQEQSQGHIQAVVNIGIGGSDLGPAMATAALAAYAQDGPEVRFLSNVDGAHFVETTRGLDPARTLFIVSSKTFTTTETMTNARTARDWLASAVGDEAARSQMAAVTANPTAAAQFGVSPDATFELWDWVGGRYSLCSAVGLSLMVAIGPDGFSELTSGGHQMDEHFRTAPWAHNLPALLGLIGVWHRNFWGHTTHAILPYSQELSRFPAYIQQLDMESSGKSVRADGDPVEVETGPVIWGQPGTNGQHAFHQLLHQGTNVVPVDLIGFCRPNHRLAGHHDLLMANLLAQAEALAFGTTDHADPHRHFPGNRPSSVILGDQLTPKTLGQLVALYEHKVFTQSVIWGINPFDQWGVELGKHLANSITEELADPAAPSPAAPRDSSTQALIARYRQRRGY